MNIHLVRNSFMRIFPSPKNRIMREPGVSPLSVDPLLILWNHYLIKSHLTSSILPCAKDYTLYCQKESKC
jgi:hypothetical protein